MPIPLDKIRQLIALGAESPSEEEGRTAARQACKLIVQHKVVLREKDEKQLWEELGVSKEELKKAYARVHEQKQKSRTPAPSVVHGHQGKRGSSPTWSRDADYERAEHSSPVWSRDADYERVDHPSPFVPPDGQWHGEQRVTVVGRIEWPPGSGASSRASASREAVNRSARTDKDESHGGVIFDDLSFEILRDFFRYCDVDFRVSADTPTHFDVTTPQNIFTNFNLADALMHATQLAIQNTKKARP